MRRIVVPSDVLAVMSPGEVVLGRRESHYARDVLRMGIGDEVTLIDGVGMTGRGRITGVDKAGVRVFLNEFGKASALESPLRLTLLMSLPKGDKWELIIQKTTELGIDRLWPLYTSRTEVRVPESKVDERCARWSRIAAEAARQCGRSMAPEVGAPMALGDALGLLAQEPGVDLKLVAWEGLAAVSRRGLDEVLMVTQSTPKDVVILVGGEGGLEDSEVSRCVERGFVGVSLGPRILRAETAAIAFVALLQHRLGDIG